MKLFALPLVAVLLASGCSAGLTGQQLTRSSAQRPDPTIGDVELLEISADLVTRMHAERPAPQVPDELLEFQPEPYRIGAGDTLYITVWDHPELTSPAGTQQQQLANGRLVRPDGTLFYPYIGPITAAGLTIEDLRLAISMRLATYIKVPQVDISVIDYGSQRVTVQGAFVDTAPIQVTARPLTLRRALGDAGIDTDDADLSGLIITRDGRRYRLDLDALNRTPGVVPDLYLKAGDHLFLPYNDRKEVYVVGEVFRPQAITFKTTDLTLAQALGRSGGLDPQTARGDAVYVIRGMEDMSQPSQVFHLDARKATAFVLAGHFRLQPGDVVFVGPARVTRWARFIDQLLPFSNIINNSANTRDLIN